VRNSLLRVSAYDQLRKKTQTSLFTGDANMNAYKFELQHVIFRFRTSPCTSKILEGFMARMKLHFRGHIGKVLLSYSSMNWLVVCAFQAQRNMPFNLFQFCSTHQKVLVDLGQQGTAVEVASHAPLISARTDSQWQGVWGWSPKQTQSVASWWLRVACYHGTGGWRTHSSL
jgi:hypothetical protein